MTMCNNCGIDTNDNTVKCRPCEYLATRRNPTGARGQRAELMERRWQMLLMIAEKPPKHKDDLEIVGPVTNRFIEVTHNAKRNK